jgi:hypothetical protein
MSVAHQMRLLTATAFRLLFPGDDRFDKDCNLEWRSSRAKVDLSLKIDSHLGVSLELFIELIALSADAISIKCYVF